MSRAQVYGHVPNGIQLMQSKVLHPLNGRVGYTLQPGCLSTNGLFPVQSLEPNMTVLVFSLLLAIAGAKGGYSRSSLQAGESSEATDEPGGTADVSAQTEVDADPALEGTPSSATESTSAAESHRTNGSGVSPELLPPKDRILQRVQESGGRIYQQELVQMMDRSESTVSRYLSQLEEDERITRIRDRRQNIVMLPDEYDWTHQFSSTDSESN